MPERNPFCACPEIFCMTKSDLPLMIATSLWTPEPCTLFRCLAICLMKKLGEIQPPRWDTFARGSFIRKMLYPFRIYQAIFSIRAILPRRLQEVIQRVGTQLSIQCTVFCLARRLTNIYEFFSEFWLIILLLVENFVGLVKNLLAPTVPTIFVSTFFDDLDDDSGLSAIRSIR